MAEEVGIPGHVKLSEAVSILGMSHMWVRRMVREGKLPHVRDEKGRIWIPVEALESYKVSSANRKQLAADRKAGLVPRSTGARVPSYVRSIKSAVSMVGKMDIDVDSKETTLIVLNELLSAQVARWQAAKAATTEAE